MVIVNHLIVCIAVICIVFQEIMNTNKTYDIKNNNNTVLIVPILIKKLFGVKKIRTNKILDNTFTTAILKSNTQLSPVSDM